MPTSTVRSFAEPDEYQAWIRAANARFLVTGSGEYRAELMRIDLDHLWMQRSKTSLPQIAHSVVSKERNPIFFLCDARQASIHVSGVELAPCEILFYAPSAEHHIRFPAESHWGAMSLSPEKLAEAGRAMLGYELVAPANSRVLRPAPRSMRRLLSLHGAVARLAMTNPGVLAEPEVARSVEQALVQGMVECLQTDPARAADGKVRRRVPVMRRFERILEANGSRPLYVADVCAAIGVTDRTLRLHCLEHLGVNPHRYLWLRRMQHVRRTLALADPAATTVTAIAVEHGFAELGRFAVAYREVFGESPSVTLHRPPDHRASIESRPLESRFPILP